MRAILGREPDLLVCGEAATGREALARTLELKPDLLITQEHHMCPGCGEPIAVRQFLETITQLDQVSHAIGVAGHESTLAVPFTLTSSPDRISAAGSVVLRQSDLGLTPLRVMLGALQVQDDITVKFRFVAVPRT